MWSISLPKEVDYRKWINVSNEEDFRMMVERVEGHLFMYRRPIYRVFQYLETSE